MLTGQVGEVLEESARIALSWIRSNAYELGLEPFPQAVHAVHDVHPTGILPAADNLRLGAQRVLLDATALPSTQRDGAYRPHSEAASAAPGGPSSSASSHPACGLGGAAVVLDNSALAGAPQSRSPAARMRDGAVSRGRVGDALEGGATTAGGSATAGNPATSWDIHIHLPAGACRAAWGIDTPCFPSAHCLSLSLSLAACLCPACFTSHASSLSTLDTSHCCL